MLALGYLLIYAVGNEKEGRQIGRIKCKGSKGSTTHQCSNTLTTDGMSISLFPCKEP